MGFSEWMEHNWFRWLFKGVMAGAVSWLVGLIGNWFLALPIPFNIAAGIALTVAYGYVIEEIGIYGGE